MFKIKSFYTNGHVLLHRKLLTWEWYDDIYTSRLFIHLLLTVNWYDEKWKGLVIKRSQRVASYKTLAEETKLTLQQVRTAIKHLKSTNELTLDLTECQSKKYSVITILNYDSYQIPNTVTNTKTTRNQHATNTVPTLNKEDKNNNNENKKDIAPSADSENGIDYSNMERKWD